MSKPTGLDPEIYSYTQGEGPHVILIHGMGSSTHSWEFIGPALVEAGYQIHALDLLGHGQSAKPSNPDNYHIDSVYRLAHDWIESHSFKGPVWLMGHSMGGYISLQYALDHPKKVRKMTLISPFFNPRQLTPGLQAATRNPSVSARVIEKIPNWAVTPFVKYNKNIAAGLPGESIDKMTEDFKRIHPNILLTAPSTRDLTPRLGKIKVPTQVIWGQQDRTLRPDYFTDLVRELPNAAGKWLPNCGHTPHLTHSSKLIPWILGDS